jgi:uncharacterized protein (TIGR02147 family)
MKSTDPWEPSFIEALLGSRTYVEFLAQFFESKNFNIGQSKPLSYAQFARRAGFASRAYARELALGQKKITDSNLHRVIQALKLSNLLREFFVQLVKQDPINNLRQGKILSVDEISKLKNRIRLQIAGHGSTSPSKIYNSESSAYFDLIPHIFAASGRTDEGASIDEILERTRFHRRRTLVALEEMIKIGLLIKNQNNKYIPCSPHIAIDKLGGNEYFQRDYERSLALVAKSFRQQSKNPNALFLASNFCVSRKHLPTLRESLRQTIIEFVNSHENPDGDCVTEINIAFLTNE